MQYKNPIDNELVAASEEIYTFIVRLAESMGITPDYGIPLRLKKAIANARIEMQAQEDADAADFAMTSTAPPTSND